MAPLRRNGISAVVSKLNAVQLTRHGVNCHRRGIDHVIYKLQRQWNVTRPVKMYYIGVRLNIQ